MPFVKGQSGNPAGRPVGSRNRFTQEMDEAFEQQGLELIGKLVSLAQDGNPVALRLCVDRLVAPRKHRHYQIQMPSPNEPDYARAALAEIQRALAEGEIPTDEAMRLLGYVERANRMLAAQVVAAIDLATRMERVEKAVTRCLTLLGAAPDPREKADGPPTAPPADPAAGDGPIVNNNAETMASTPAEAASAAAPTAQPTPVVKNNENPVIAMALDSAVQATLAHVRPRRSIRARLMESVSPLALMVGLTPANTTPLILPDVPVASAA